MKNIIRFTFMLASAGIVSCTSDAKIEDQGQDRVLPVTTIISRDTILHREYIGDLQATQNVEIRARVEGFLEKIHVDEGQTVKKGQLLFSINDEEYQAELAKAKANLTSAIAASKSTELELDRVKILVDKKVVTKTELEVAKANLDAARAKIEEARSAYENAQIKLSHTSIKAPFDGIVDRLPLKAGSLIEEGALLTTISDNRSIYAYFNVSETEYLSYLRTLKEDPESSSNIVALTLADGSLFPYPGKIETMEGDFERGTGSIAFRAKFPNPDGVLKHGSSGRIRLTDKVSSALMLPQKAVFEIQDKNYVFVVDSSNTVRMKSFVPKSRVSHFYIVETGLESGEKIIYEGVQELRDGMKIKPQYVPMDSLITVAASASTTAVN